MLVLKGDEVRLVVGKTTEMKDSAKCGITKMWKNQTE